MQLQPSGFQALPVELVYEIQLYATSPSLPYLSHHFLGIFRGSPISFRVQFLLASCINTISTPLHTAEIFSQALRYPLCTLPVLDLLHSRLISNIDHSTIIPYTPPSTPTLPFHKCKLPRRFFRSLAAPRKEGEDWKITDEPLPFLMHILRKGDSFPPLDPNCYQGYALTKAVHARHIPLIEILLALGASPVLKDGMAVKVAIKQKNLRIVKMLVEREDRDGPLASYSPSTGEVQRKQKGKRRRLEDRVEVDQSMLRLAVKCNAKDIIDYLAWEKGVVPDMQTLRSLTALKNNQGPKLIR